MTLGVRGPTAKQRSHQDRDSLQDRQSVRPRAPYPATADWTWTAESAPIRSPGPNVSDYPIVIADTLIDGSIGGHPSGRVPSGDGLHPRPSDPRDSAHRHGDASHRSSRTRSRPGGSIGGHPSGRVPSGDGPHPRPSDPHDSVDRRGGSSHRSSPSPCGQPGRS